MSKFEIGEGYFTREGFPAGVEAIRDHGRILQGWIQFHGGRVDARWHHDGRMNTNATNPNDLMPRDTATDRLDKLEAMCTDIFRQLRAFRESRNDGLATANHAIVNLIERVDRLKEQLDALPTLTDVRQIHSRINRLSGTLNDLGGITADAAHTTPQSTIIHAGWVNIYREPDGSMNTGCLYDSKERAIGFAVKPDHLKHIACIRIPAFKEGEGL